MGKHYIPQEYLRGFSIPNSEEQEIYRYEKNSSEPKRLPIDKVAQMKELYPQQVETILTTNYENPANKILKRLRDGFHPEFQDRLTLIDYMILMWQRTPYKRDEIKNQLEKEVPKRIQEIMDETDRLIQEMPDKKDIIQQRRDLFISKYESGDFSNDEIWLRLLIEAKFPLIRSTMLKMNWITVHSEKDDYFITGDCPFFFTRGIGLSNKESEVIFPISSKTILWINWYNIKKRQFKAGHSLATEINKRMFSISERYIYSPFSSNWLKNYCLSETVQLQKLNLTKSLFR